MSTISEARWELLEAVLSRIVERWAEEDPDRICIVQDDGEQLTYAELNRRADRIARGLMAAGLEPGDRVVSLLPNDLTTVLLMIALAKAGAVDVPINPALRGESLAFMLRDSSPRFAVVSRAEQERVQESLPEGVACVIHHPEGEGEEARGGEGAAHLSLEAMLATEADPVTTTAQGPDLASIMYTSGTTGVPKGVMVSHRHLIRTGENVQSGLKLSGDDTLITVLPLFHAGGRYANLVPCLIFGARCLLIRKFSASRFWDQAIEHGATVMYVVISMLRFLLAQEPSQKECAHRVTRGMIAQVDEALDRQVQERFGVKSFGMYGSTECSLPVINPDGPRAACGKPQAPYRLWIVDEHDRRLGPGDVGEIVVASDEPWSTYSGYWNRPEATAEANRNYAFHTGDAGYLDEDGYLWFVNRIKDSIRRRGENISSVQVEQVVNSVAGVLESAAYPVASDYGEDEVAIAIVTKPGEMVTVEAVMDRCRGELPEFAHPSYIRFEAEFPKTGTGKVQKTVLKEEGVVESMHRVEV